MTQVQQSVAPLGKNIARMKRAVEGIRARELLKCPSNPENFDFLLNPNWCVATDDVDDYAAALWSPQSPAYPLDTFRLREYFESFWAMRPSLAGRHGRLRPPMPLVRAKVEHRERRRAVVTFGELILPTGEMLQDKAKSCGVVVGWRGRSVIEQVCRGIRRLTSELYDHHQTPVRHWPEVADLILARPGGVAIALSNPGGAVSIGFGFTASAIECSLFGSAENIGRNNFMNLLDLSLALEAAGGALAVARSSGKGFELTARIPIPAIVEEPTDLGQVRLKASVGALAKALFRHDVAVSKSRLRHCG